MDAIKHLVGNLQNNPPPPIHPGTETDVILNGQLSPSSTTLAVDNASDTDVTTDLEDVERKTSKRQRLKRLGRQAKAAPKRLLMRVDLLSHADTHLDADEKVIDGITDNPAFNTGEFLEKDRNAISSAASKAASLVKGAARTVVDPKHHPKRKTAGIITASEHPYLTAEADEELLQAHADLKSLSSAGTGDPEDERTIVEQQQRIQELQDGREMMRTAWLTGKHVKRARVVQCAKVDYPVAGNFYEVDEKGRQGRWQWEMYFGHLLLYFSQDFTPQYIEDSNDVAFRRQTLINNAERFMMASTPWQLWAMHVRKVYRWEDRALTLKWFAAFFFLLKTGYVTTFAYLWIIYIVVKNRVMRDDIRFLRESHERSSDKNSRVYTISELVMQHGGEDWIDPLLQEMGPLIQQQLGDLADFMEVLMNFYQWRDPRATIITIIFWLTCAFVSACCSTEYGLKIVWWVVGFYFFCSRPIASYYPKYRKAVSLVRWIHWNIPTHAELAFRDLRADAQKARNQIIRENAAKQPLKRSSAAVAPDATSQGKHSNPTFTITDTAGDGTATHLLSSSYSSDSSSSSSSSPLKTSSQSTSTDILSFRGKYNSHTGRLVITTTGLRFLRTLNIKHTIRHPGLSPSASTDELWHHPFSDLLELRKASMASAVRGRISGRKDDSLVLMWVGGGAEYVIGAMRKRDEAFNAVVGFSGLRFMVCQPAVDGGGEASDGEKTLKGGEEGSVFDELGKL